MEGLRQVPVLVLLLLLLVGVGYLIQREPQKIIVRIESAPPQKNVASPSRQFARGLARQTGLDFPVALAWTRVEGGAPNNFLNIRSLPTSRQTSPESAGRIAGIWIEDGYLGSSLEKIAETSGKSPKEQIRVIARGWSAFSGYRSLLQKAYNQTVS